MSRTPIKRTATTLRRWVAGASALPEGSSPRPSASLDREGPVAALSADKWATELDPRLRRRLARRIARRLKDLGVIRRPSPMGKP